VINPPALGLNCNAPSLKETVNGNLFATMTNRMIESSTREG
jgi:hypothetical protein